MKSAPFDYVRARSIPEVCRFLAEDPDAAILAGGQTLVPMMAMRLARPSRLIDIARIPGLRGMRDAGATFAIGATTRQAEALESPEVACKVPLLHKVLPWVGHAATRHRGTIGGCVANADPAAEVALVLVTLGGDVVTQNLDGSHRRSAGDFILGPMMTALARGSCITEVSFPVWSHGYLGVGFQEVGVRRSDFALASAAAQVALDAAGRCLACAIGIGAVTAAPVHLQSASEALIGSSLLDAEISEVVGGAVERLDLMASTHASESYQRRAATALATRAVVEARDAAVRRIGG